jgi:hypothetical protein
MSDQQPGNDRGPIDWRALESSGVNSPKLNDEMMPASWRDWVKETTAGVNTPVGSVLLDLVVSAAGGIGNSRAAVATVDFAQPSLLWARSSRRRRNPRARLRTSSILGQGKVRRRRLPAGRGQFDDDDRGIPKRSP